MGTNVRYQFLKGKVKDQESDQNIDIILYQFLKGKVKDALTAAPTNPPTEAYQFLKGKVKVYYFPFLRSAKIVSIPQR